MRGRIFVVGAIVAAAAGFALVGVLSKGPQAPVKEAAPLTTTERAALGRLAENLTDPMPPPPKIVSVTDEARLCPVADCGDGAELARIAMGASLEVLDARPVQGGVPGAVRWFRVEHDGHTGWISEFTTDHAPRLENGKWVRE